MDAQGENRPTLVLDPGSPASAPPQAVCRHCRSAQPESGYETPLCAACRRTLVKRPFPIWVVGTAAVTILLVFVSFLRFPSAVQFGVAYERADRQEQKNDYRGALKNYHLVASRYPNSPKLQAHLGIAQYRSGDVAAAMTTFQGLEGKELPKELTTQIEGILAEVDQMIAADKARKGGQ